METADCGFIAWDTVKYTGNGRSDNFHGKITVISDYQKSQAIIQKLNIFTTYTVKVYNTNDMTVNGYWQSAWVLSSNLTLVMKFH